MQILAHTPPWVFGLFVLLVVLGINQTRARRISRVRLAVLPLAMAGLALLGVWSSFAAHAIALAAWLCVLLAVVAGSLWLPPPRATKYSPEAKLFSVPGSWIPLALMMGIFLTKYAIAVVRVVDPALLAGTGAVAATCALYGLYSGLFLARAVRVARTAMRGGGLTLERGAA